MGLLVLFLLTGCRTQAGPASVSAASTPASSPAPKVTLALLGDVMLGRDVHPSAESFAYLDPYLGSADLVMANLESPLTGAPVQSDSPYTLCAPPERATVLAEAGFDLLTVANNHNLDCGEEGLLETRSALAEAGLGYAGPGMEPVFRTLNGIRLAVLAFDATGPFELERAVQAVRAARATGATVIVSIHWGAEYQAGASSFQEEIALRLAQAGAALIWGHHPHVLQPADWIDNGQTLVFYSLGNALFDQYGLADTRQSALALVTLGPEGVTGFQVVPFLIDVPHSRVVEADAESTEGIMGYFK